jgi:hypothetical protein
MRLNGDGTLTARFLLTPLRTPTEKGTQMLGRVYTFEREGASSERPVSTLAAETIHASINGCHGIHYHELTAPGRPKPVFAVFFPDAAHKQYFEDLLGPALTQCGLKINIVHTLEEREPAVENPANEQPVSSGLDVGLFTPLLATAET